MHAETAIKSEIHALEERLAALRLAAETLESAPVFVELAPPPVANEAPAEPPPARPLPRERFTGRVLRLVTSGSATTSSAIRLATGAGHVEVAHALQALERRGLIRRTGEQGPRLNGRGRAPHVYQAVAP